MSSMCELRTEIARLTNQSAQVAAHRDHCLTVVDKLRAQQVAVPMTEQELDDLLPTNDSMSRKDSQRWIARAVERRNGIGVKP